MRSSLLNKMLIPGIALWAMALIFVASAVGQVSPYDSASHSSSQSSGSSNSATLPVIPGQTQPEGQNVAQPGTSGQPAGSVSSMVSSIGVGDLLRVGVLGAPEFDQESRVDGDGNLPVAMIGPTHVAGLTTQEASQVIRKKLMDGGFFADPQVTLFVKEYITQGVSVLGEVKNPGIYPLLGPRRLFDVISMAGGTSEKAGETINITHRTSPDKVQSVTMSRDTSEFAQNNVQIQPGDTVMVSKAGVIYVVGDVKKPSGVVMESGTNISVLQAIAMAEGPNTTANLKSAKIIRRTKGQQPQEIPIDLKKIMSAKVQDVQLQPEDIVFVPSSTSKTVGVRTLDSIVRVATGVAVYRAP